MLAGSPSETDQIVDVFNDQFNLGTVIDGPSRIPYFGYNVIQSDDSSFSVDKNDKVLALEYMPLCRSRRKELDAQLDSIKKRFFASFKCSIGKLGITVSLFYSEFDSGIHRKVPHATVKDYVDETSGRKLPFKKETVIYYLTVDYSDRTIGKINCIQII